MAKRLAFFASKEDVENYYSLTTKKENLFEPHYNLSPGQHIVTITGDENKKKIGRVRWGDEAERKSVIPVDEVEGELKKEGVKRCIQPISGFFVWKDDLEKGHPFFVRMLNSPLMSTGGLIYKGDDENVKIIVTESNVLVQPMSATMPLLLDRETSFLWMSKDSSTAEVISKARKLFLFTDLSIMRVSKKVNNPNNNDEKLIQPIPK
jgi:putative SOS response-associated peptidase YedK